MIDQYFNKIYVVESLQAGERQTGKELHDDLLQWKADQIAELTVELLQIRVKQELLYLLDTVSKEIPQKDILPIIHLEIHGSDQRDGLILANNEFVSWEEMKSVLTKINVASRNNLFVTLAVCYGAYLIRILKPTDRAPVWGLVGPVEDVEERDIAVSFSGFYDELLTSFNCDRAVKVLNESILGKPYRYYFENCLSLFKEVFRDHLAENYTPNAIEERSTRMAEKARDHPKWIGIQHWKIKRQFKRELLNNRKYFFEKFREKFLMYDIYPENKQRFPVTFKEVTIPDG